jgi:hypothetical protein
MTMNESLQQVHPVTPQALMDPEALTEDELSAVGGGAVDNPNQTAM